MASPLRAGRQGGQGLCPRTPAGHQGLQGEGGGWRGALSSPTCVHRAVTGQVAFVAEGGPAQLTLVRFVLIPRSQGVQPRRAPGHSLTVLAAEKFTSWEGRWVTSHDSTTTSEPSDRVGNGFSLSQFTVKAPGARLTYSRSRG